MPFQFTKDDNIVMLVSENYMIPEQNQILVEDLKKLLDSNKKKFIINLEGMPYINSTGLSFFIQMLTRARTAGGEIVLCCVSEKIDQLLIMTRLKSIFTIFNNFEEALHFFSDSSK
jgi:anti-sigma B factor antagonist